MHGKVPFIYGYKCIVCIQYKGLDTAIIAEGKTRKVSFQGGRETQ